MPSGLIYRAADMLDDPHFAAREAIVSTPHPHFGTLRMQNVAPRLSASPGSIRTPAPELGQHNDGDLRRTAGARRRDTRRLSRARRDLKREMKKAGRLRPAFSFIVPWRNWLQVLSSQSLAIRAMVGSCFTVLNAFAASALLLLRR